MSWFEEWFDAGWFNLLSVSGVLVSPGPLNAAAKLTDPAIRVDQRVSAGLLTAAVQLQIPVVRLGVTAGLSTMTIRTSIPAPAIRTGAMLTAPALAMKMVPPGATAIIHAQVAVAVQQVTASLPRKGIGVLIEI